MQPANGTSEVQKAEIIGRSNHGPDNPPHLSDVVRDAMTQAELIARDSISLGRLEGERVLDKAKDEAGILLDKAKDEAGHLFDKAKDDASDLASDLLQRAKNEAERVGGEAKEAAKEAAPRLAYAGISVTVGALGYASGLVAAFIGLGYVLPDLAIRFAIFAVVLLATSLVFWSLAKRTPRRPGLPENRLV